MKINELIWFKAIYPRNRDQLNDNEVKVDEENVGKIKDYIRLKKKLPQKITYNKRTMHIIDGTHTWIAASELGWKDIPKSDLEEIDIPIEQEMWEAAKLNAAHGKQLSRKEIQAIFWMYFKPDQKAGYASLSEFSKDFNIPKGTLDEWLYMERGHRDANSRDHESSSGNEGRQPDFDSDNFKLKIAQLEGERDKERTEKEEMKEMKDDVMNDNMGLKERIKKLEGQLDDIPKRCPKCNTKIY